MPVPALADPPFQLLHADDAARAMVEALVRRAEGAFNVVGPGAASPWQAVRLGNRIPVPFLGPGWLVATRVAELAGSPVPPHVLELIRKGCVADGGRAEAELGSHRPRPHPGGRGRPLRVGERHRAARAQPGVPADPAEGVG